MAERVYHLNLHDVKRVSFTLNPKNYACPIAQTRAVAYVTVINN